jgi:hypothetical protein
VVEKSATDGDSDHTDTEATVDSENTCELAVTRCLDITLIFNHVYIEDLGMGS